MLELSALLLIWKIFWLLKKQGLWYSLLVTTRFWLRYTPILSERRSAPLLANNEGEKDWLEKQSQCTEGHTCCPKSMTTHGQL